MPLGTAGDDCVDICRGVLSSTSEQQRGNEARRERRAPESSGSAWSRQRAEGSTRSSTATWRKWSTDTAWIQSREEYREAKQGKSRR